MTNADYIRENISDSDLALLISIFPESAIIDKAYGAWSRWAQSTTDNHGNMAGNNRSDPSIWFYERWYYPSVGWIKKGRPSNVSKQVWLSMQYNPEEWEDEE